MADLRVFAILVTFSFTGVLSAAVDDFELKLVHIVSRHGDRCPDYPTYPTDPYLNYTFPPYGWSQLTNKGRETVYENGKFFRKRYDEFLGKNYNPADIHAQSTGMTRTRMSLQLFMAGMFPPKNTDLQWNPNLDWQPVDTTYKELTNDLELFPLYSQNCPRWNVELVKNYDPVVQRNKALFDQISSFTNTTFKSPFDVIGICYALKTVKEYGLPLPPWTKSFYPQPLTALMEEAWTFISYNDFMDRVMGGHFLQKIFSDWEKKIANNFPTKMNVHSAHDLTVVQILSAFNAWDKQPPNYGISAVFELVRQKSTGIYGVQLYLRNKPNGKSEPVFKPLTIAGCKHFCPLSTLKSLLSNHFPVNTAAECAV